MHDQAIIPHLCVSPAAEAIDFYKRAFGFEEIHRLPSPDGKILHCELRLGDAWFMLADEFPNMGTGSPRSPRTLNGSTVTIHINAPNVDAAFDRAVKAGARVSMPVADMFWGDRYGKLIDPFGHHWSISTHKEDVSPEEMKKRADALFKNWGKK